MFKFELCCKNLKNSLTCFYASENVMLSVLFKINKTKLYKQGDNKFYCDRCKESVFTFQNVKNFDYHWFYESAKPSISEKSDSYLYLYSVKFDKKIVIVLFL